MIGKEMPGVLVRSSHFQITFCFRFESTRNIVSVISGFMYSVLKLEPKQNRTAPWALLLLKNDEISLRRISY
uniref:Uncharacterized protein n=1 Tax=Glossina palpalis gambiensis TaxID=67801 RepID=A0A1B0AS64_9MUSC